MLQNVLAAADTLAARTGLRRFRTSPERLIDLARRQARCDDFGGAPPLDALRRLLSACEQEASLSLFGQFALRWDSLRFLGNLLRLRAQESRSPGLLTEPIEKPIFITGLPRSGTTFLHRLMLEDPVSRAPLVWHTIYPCTESEPDKSIRQVSRQLRGFELLAPDFRGLHPITAESPQECSEITAHVFRSLRFDTTYRIPSYRRWLDAEGQHDAYEFERRFLQHLQHRYGRGRWVLKCPDHLFALPELKAAFPDARMVFVHRDPLNVLLSVAHLTEVLRRPFTRQLDRIGIGRQESARWLDGTARMIRAAREEPFAEPIFHVGYRELVGDPVGTIAQVYRHFGLELDAPTRNRMTRAVAVHPDGGYRHDAYRFEDHGLDEAVEREKFADYTRFFGIEAEPPRAAATPARHAA
ncbi:MAG TPA: sulfotransferase [Acetobacteraceae bacterium]|nr:sulfotransferase [Acetobacteraceae bacterium]